MVRVSASGREGTGVRTGVRCKTTGRRGCIGASRSASTSTSASTSSATTSTITIDSNRRTRTAMVVVFFKPFRLLLSSFSFHSCNGLVSWGGCMGSFLLCCFNGEGPLAHSRSLNKFVNISIQMKGWGEGRGRGDRERGGEGERGREGIIMYLLGALK